MSSVSDVNRTRSEGNGAASLQERVRSLRLPAAGDEGPRRGSLMPWALCFIFMFTTAAFGYRAYRIAPAGDAQSSESSSTPDTRPAAPASVATSGDVVLRAKGYVIPAHQVQVSPKVGGMIVWLNPKFMEGQFFAKDAELARLETDDYQAEYDRAVAALKAAEQRRDEQRNYRPEEIDQAQQELDETRATLRQMDLDLQRNLRLAGASAVAQRELEQARYGRDAMARRASRLEAALKLMKEGPRKEKLLAAEADVKAAEADRVKAKWRLDNCIIRAPIAGHVLTKKAEKGNVVNPLAFNVAASLCEMADLSDLEIDLSIQEREIKEVYDGQACWVMPEAYQDHKPFRDRYPQGYAGTVSRQMPIADRSKGAIQVRVKVTIPPDEVGKYLKPDMSVVVYFQKAEKAEKKLARP